ncbi:MAG: polysaccharide biosynthesis/export family protein [Hyphomicrobiaceae bacterium]
MSEPAAIGSQLGALKHAVMPRLGVADHIRLKVYQRDDISGDYAVREDGTIVIPVLGQFEAFGKTAKEVENRIVDALMMATSAPVNVSLDVAQWRPIYVLGGVDKPGIYPYTPGMTILHALAAAGGMYRLGANNMNLAVDIARESGQYQQNVQRLKSALALEARLSAERRGAEDVKTPARLLEIASKTEVDQLMGDEVQILKRRQQVRTNHSDMKDKEIATLKSELAALEAQYEVFDEREKQLSTELTEVSGIAKRGLATNERVRSVRRDATDARAQKPVVLATIIRVRRSIEQMSRERDLRIAELDLQLDQQLSAARNDVINLELALNQSRFLMGQIAGVGADGSAQAAGLGYQVSRMVDGKLVNVAVDETTTLNPGDIVRIAGAGAPAGINQVAGRQQPMATPYNKATFVTDNR